MPRTSWFDDEEHWEQFLVLIRAGMGREEACARIRDVNGQDQPTATALIRHLSRNRDRYGELRDSERMADEPVLYTARRHALAGDVSWARLYLEHRHKQNQHDEKHILVEHQHTHTLELDMDEEELLRLIASRADDVIDVEEVPEALPSGANKGESYVDEE